MFNKIVLFLIYIHVLFLGKYLGGINETLKEISQILSETEYSKRPLCFPEELEYTNEENYNL